jgi:hypothetical protein
MRTILCTLACLEMVKLFKTEQNLGLGVSGIHSRKNITINGDLILGGLFSLHRSYPNAECKNQTSNRNIMRVEAMLYAIEEVRGRLCFGITF